MADQQSVNKRRLLRHLLPQNNTGSWAWLLHRLTGVALAVYLLPHFMTIYNARQGPEALDSALAWYTGPLIALSEWVLIMAVAFHAFNGLRLIAMDFLDLSHRQKALFWLAMAGCLLVFIGATFVFLPKILGPI